MNRKRSGSMLTKYSVGKTPATNKRSANKVLACHCEECTARSNLIVSRGLLRRDFDDIRLNPPRNDRTVSQRPRREAKRKQIKKKGDPFLVNVCESHPMLAVAWEHQE